MPSPIDWGEVEAFIEALGRSDTPLVLALFPPQQGPCIHIPCSADDIPTTQIEDLLRRHPAHSLGLVINPPLPTADDWGQADHHFHKNRRTGGRGPLKTWGAQAVHIAKAIAIWAECDGGLSIEAQEALPSMAGLPVPSLSIWTGGKSLHHYWILTPGQELNLDAFSRLQARLAHAFLQVAPDSKPDDGLGNANRIMRVPGGPHPATGQRAFIHHHSTETFTAAELDAALPQLPQGTRLAASPNHTSPSGGGRYARWFSDLPGPVQRSLAVQLLSLLPPRQAPGNGTYPQAFATLAALVHHFGADTAVAICEEAGWKSDHWDPATKVHDIGPARVQASIGKLVARAATEAGWKPPKGYPPIPPAMEPIAISSRSTPPAAPPAPGALPPPPTAPGFPPPRPQHEPSEDQQLSCREILEQAVHDDLSPPDMELLLHDLSTRSEVPPFTLRALLAAIRNQVEQELSIQDEAVSLAHALALPQAELTLQQVLPPMTAYALQTITEHLPYSDAAVAMAYLASLSGLTKLGTTVCGNPATQFVVPTNLFVCTVAASGQKKTPLLKLVIDNPTRSIRLDLARENSRAMEHWREQCQGVKAGDRPPPPVPCYLQIQDYTAEALGAQLQALEARSHAVLVLRDELAGLFGSMNQYRSGRGSDEEQLLELFDGSPQVSIRKSSAGCAYSRCHVSVYGNIQPGMLRQLAEGGDITGKWARFIFSPLPPRTQPLPLAVSDQQTQEVKASNEILELMCRAVYALPPRLYQLDGEAIAAFSRYEHEKQHEALDAPLSAQAALKGKAAGKVLRIAGLLHVLACAEDSTTPSRDITFATLQTAIQVVEAHDTWAFSLHQRWADGGGDQALSDFMRRIHQLSLDIDEAVTWQRVKNTIHSRYRRGINAASAEAAMRALERQGVGITTGTSQGALGYRATGELPR